VVVGRRKKDDKDRFTIPFTVYLNEPLNDKLFRLAAQRGCSMTALVRLWIAEASELDGSSVPSESPKIPLPQKSEEFLDLDETL
jgi:hypothetical protein